MERNRLLTYSLYFFRFVQTIPIITFVAITALLVIYIIDPETVGNHSFNTADGTVEWVDEAEVAAIKNGSNFEILVKDVEPFSLYIIYIKAVAILLCTWIIIQEFRNVIRSTKEWQTFQSRNVYSFRKMGKYFLVIFLLTSFEFYVAGNQGAFKIDIELKFIMFALASFILAEIFKEGNRLQEEQQLTV